MPSLFPSAGIRLLPYPEGKTFAFTIIDDTDGETLESVRPIYDYLFSLGLCTTKTVWVKNPNQRPVKESDFGDSLERSEYADYMQLLKQRGFEIALHNVASMSSEREQIAAGIADFTRILGQAPKINVHHEKNRENLYFDFAQRGICPPSPYRTALLRGIHQRLSHNGGPRLLDHSCSGEDPHTTYFWGDLCKATIKYVRTNVFFQDLNTLKCSPQIPYSLAQTPFVNHWFDSSNGQDAQHFNSILSDKNIASLRQECGCSILYTHFGKGFVNRREGSFELNPETKARLRAVAGHADGWYAPVGEVLDRLLAFQRITVLPLSGGIVLTNHNEFAVQAVTLYTTAGRAFCDLQGKKLAADQAGKITVPMLSAGESLAIMNAETAAQARPWNSDHRSAFVLDLERLSSKLRQRVDI
jgi:hypothetical protein